MLNENQFREESVKCAHKILDTAMDHSENLVVVTAGLGDALISALVNMYNQSPITERDTLAVLDRLSEDLRQALKQHGRKE